MIPMTDMSDLKRFVQRKLRENIHGQEFDTMWNDVDIYDMLGASEGNPDGTIFDPRHEFWDGYYQDVNTYRDCFEEITSAVDILRENETFRITYPKGVEADIVYCEIDPVQEQSGQPTVCNECEAPATADISFEPSGSTYQLVVDVVCEYCGHESSHERSMVRR